jgi:hypothetical protein
MKYKEDDEKDKGKAVLPQGRGELLIYFLEISEGRL